MRNIIIILALLLPSFASPATTIREAARGEVDLRDWDGKEALRIYGDWQFFPKELLTPAQAVQRFGEPSVGYLQPGQPFRAYPGMPQDNITYGSYLIRLRSPCTHCRFHFALPQIYIAGRIFVFDDQPAATLQPLYQLGEVSTIAGEEMPQLSTLLMPSFDVGERPTLYMLVQVSNFHYYWGGLWQPPALYIDETGMPLEEVVSPFFILGIMVFCMVHSMSLYARRREDKATRELALFATIMMLRSAAFAFAWRLVLFHSIGVWELLWDFIYISLAAASAQFYRFMIACFPEQASIRIGRIIWWSAITLTLVFLITPMIDSEYLVNALYVYTTACEIASGWVLIRALRKKREGSLLAFTGVLALAISGLTALLWIMGNTTFSALGVEIGTAIFMICQTQIVAKRSASAFRRAEQLSEELVERDRARTVFFHNTSHELRTPLHGMLSFLDLISKGQYGPISDRLRLQLVKITRLTESLRDQVNTILDLAKSRRGELNLIVHKFPSSALGQRIQDIVEGLHLKHPHVPFILHNHLQHDQIFAHDLEKIVTVLRNLLSNAFKFSRSGAVNQVTLTMELGMEGLHFVVADSGIGIPADKTARIFEEFAQLQDDARRAYEGSGLGLSIVRDLLDLMKGRVDVKSTVGLGTTISVTIPLVSEAESRPEETPVIQAMPRTAPYLAEGESVPVVSDLSTGLPHPERFLVLVIDDNELNCEVVQDLLQMDGYRVLIATGGRSGIQQIESVHPHLVLLDLMMPDVSGEDVMRHIKANKGLADIPVILITARANDEDRILGLDLGADDYLAKPLVPDELRLRVRNLLTRHDQNRRLAQEEYQERMSQLGSAASDLAREWQSIHLAVNADQVTPEQRIQRVGRLLPLPAMQRDLLIRQLTKPALAQPSAALLDALIAPNPDHPAVKELQSLRALILQLPLSVEQARGLWRSITQLDSEELQQLSESIHVCQHYLQLADASQQSRELMDSILAFSRNDAEEHLVDLRLTVERSYQLLRMRLARLGIELRLQLEPLTLFTVAGDLQHLLLSLLTQAMTQVENLNLAERWISVSLSSEPDSHKILLRIAHGGRLGADVPVDALLASERLARQLHGELFYRAQGEQRYFLLILPPGHRSMAAV